MRTIKQLDCCLDELTYEVEQLREGEAGGSGLYSWNIGFVFEGDSLSTPDWSETSVPSLLAGLVNGGLIGYENYAVSGQTTTQMVSQYVSQGALSKPEDNELKWFSVEGGINDMQAGDSAADIIGRLSVLYASARADKYKVLAWTLHDWTDDAAKIAKTSAINEWILAHPELYDEVLRMDQLFYSYVDQGAEYIDRIHPNASGRARIAQAIYNLVPHGPPVANKFTGMFPSSITAPSITSTSIITVERADPSGYNKINFNTKDIGGGVTRTEWQFGPHGDNNFQVFQDGNPRTKWDFTTNELSHTGALIAQSLNAVNPYGSTALSLASNFTASGGIANMFAASLANGNYVYAAVGRQLAANESALLGLANAGTAPYAFVGIAGRPTTDFRIMPTGNVILGAMPDYGNRFAVDGTVAANVDLIAGRGVRITAPTVPSSASATGVTGDVAWDASYLYVCVATDTWKRSPLSTW